MDRMLTAIKVLCSIENYFWNVIDINSYAWAKILSVW